MCRFRLARVPKGSPQHFRKWDSEGGDAQKCDTLL